MAKNILIIEDEIILAKDLELSLIASGFDVIGIASNSKKVKRILLNIIPDIIICDINLRGDKTGIDIISELRNKYKFKLIYLTAYSDKETVALAEKTNPDNYLTKPFNEKQLLASIFRTMDDGGESSIIPTKREISIIQLLAKGYNSEQIGAELNISASTVSTHRKNILRKYNFQTTAQLIFFATKNKWIL